MRSPVRLEKRPPRILSLAPSPAVVTETGSLGYLGAAEEDRRRWLARFRALLDSLDGPLQVVIDFEPGAAASEGIGREPAGGGSPPGEAERRILDLAFAESLRQLPGGRRARVRLIASPATEPAVLALLEALGIPGRPAPGRPEAVFGSEAWDAYRDRGGWHRTWVVDRYPGGELEPGWLLRLVPSALRISLSWHARRVPSGWMIEFLQRQLVRMRAAQLGRGLTGVADPMVEGAVPAAEGLQRRLAAGEESAFHVGLYLTLTAGSPGELADGGAAIEAAARSALCGLVAAEFRQAAGRTATMALGADPLARHRVLDTSALLTLFPWFHADLQDPEGLVLGTSRDTGQPVLIDPFRDARYANANVGVFGHSGAGKTYLLSSLAMSSLALGSQVFIVDPEREYGRLAGRLGGLEVNLALGSPHAINVLDLRGAPEEADAMGPAVADAVDLCDVICGGLDQAERADLEVAARRAFGQRAEPVLADVAHLLAPESRTARVLARWVNGSLGQMFSRPTNIDLEAPLLVFAMRELRAEMVAPVHYLLAEALWARIKRRDRRRLLIIDELGLLFEDPAIRRFVVALARRIRKYNGALAFATQNPGDLLASEEGLVVATNPALHLFGAQRPGEAARLERAFNLSPQQRASLEAARRGQFLLAAGSERVALQVRAPPWQVAAMAPGRSPPPP